MLNGETITFEKLVGRLRPFSGVSLAGARSTLGTSSGRASRLERSLERFAPRGAFPADIRSDLAPRLSFQPRCVPKETRSQAASAYSRGSRREGPSKEPGSGLEQRSAAGSLDLARRSCDTCLAIAHSVNPSSL
ncbi:hypothetical protein KM043_000510 [Ampulex compressa]|nr:hypothetical protein KM043_000510 [Ampulex compressa]